MLEISHTPNGIFPNFRLSSSRMITPSGTCIVMVTITPSKIFFASATRSVGPRMHSDQGAFSAFGSSSSSFASSSDLSADALTLLGTPGVASAFSRRMRRAFVSACNVSDEVCQHKILTITFSQRLSAMYHSLTASVTCSFVFEPARSHISEKANKHEYTQDGVEHDSWVIRSPFELCCRDDPFVAVHLDE